MSTPMHALRGPHGGVGEYLGAADYFGQPGAQIRRMAGVSVVPASQVQVGGEWSPVPGRVVVHEHQTGRWNTPVERWLEVVADHAGS
jgi:hypothetical protein